MTAYAFGTGRIEGDNGSRGTMYDVSLDFAQSLQELATGDNKVAIALGDGELRITGIAKRVTMVEGVIPESGQVYFKTTTSNFGVAKEVTIKLNNCLFKVSELKGNEFEAKADKHGNVFTLSMEG